MYVCIVIHVCICIYILCMYVYKYVVLNLIELLPSVQHQIEGFCLYVCIYVCVYVYFNECMQAPMYVYLNKWRSDRVMVRLGLNVYFIRVECMYVCMKTQICTYVLIGNKHIYIHTYIHTYVHT